MEAGPSPTWTNNLDSDPLFVSPQNGDYHLPLFSPCIDAGDPNFVTKPDETDIDGEAHVFHDLVDIGSDEYHDCNDNGVADHADIADGTSLDCNENAIPDECDITDEAVDCDENGMPDECQPDTDGVCDSGDLCPIDNPNDTEAGGRVKGVPLISTGMRS